MKKLVSFLVLAFISVCAVAQTNLVPNKTAPPTSSNRTAVFFEDNQLKGVSSNGTITSFTPILSLTAASQFSTQKIDNVLYDGYLWKRKAGSSTYDNIVKAKGDGSYYYERTFDGDIDPTWFGAKNDSTFNSAPAIQAALNYAATSGKRVVRLPKGYYALMQTITVPIGVILRGALDKPAYKFVNNFVIDNTVIMVKTAQSVNTPAIIVLYNSGVESLTLYWPYQLKTLVTPIQYGWGITTNGQSSNGDGVSIKNIMLVNAYNGINIDYGGQWDIDNVKGQCLNIGINLDRVFDVARISNIHFWDFWATGADAIKPYILNNAIVLNIGRVDGLQANNIFGWAHKNVIHTYFSDHNSTNPAESGACWGLFNNVKSDLCKIALQIDRSEYIQINNLNGTTADIASGYHFIETSQDVSGEVSINNFVGFHTNALAYITSNTGNFKFTNVTKRQRGDANDVTYYKIINEGTAKVTIDEANYDDISGNVQIGTNIRWFDNNTDITSTLPNFTNLSLWTIVDSRISAITNGYRFSLSGGVGVQRYGSVPTQLSTPAGVFVLECDIQLNNPAALGAGQFYFRLTDLTTNDIVFPSNPTRFYFNRKTHIKIPFIVRSTGFAMDFVFGNGGLATVDVTNLKISKVNYAGTALTDWVQTKQPNALKLTLPTILK